MSQNLPNVFIGIPTSGGVAGGVLTATHVTGSRHKIADIVCVSRSLLTQNFNGLFVAALNSRPRVDYFVMLHADVQPGAGWVDELIQQATLHDAAVCSVVVPIKNESGVTSTAVLDPETNRLRRLTMREVCKLPVTFDAASAGFPGQVLLINTGCWIADLRTDWPDRWIARGGCFRNQDRIIRCPDGSYAAQTFSEDWVFGCDLHTLGVRAVATRAVRVRHKGEFDFPNDAPWGSWESDQAVHETFDISAQSQAPWPVPSREPTRGKVHAVSARPARPVDCHQEAGAPG